MIDVGMKSILDHLQGWDESSSETSIKVIGGIESSEGPL